MLRFPVVQSAAMMAIVTALRKGVPAEDLKGMVDAAASALEAATEQTKAGPSPAGMPTAPLALKAEDSKPGAPPEAVVAQEVCVHPDSRT